ncbi:MAG: dihydrofolate synthase/folylpolyglutamate synthase [Salibacteraceae bacterium]|jgi:dihydrofolate synthase/folylpolyglutamate synthase
MTYPETLNYLFSQLPMYQREGKSAYKANLDNTLRLDNYLGHPHQSFKSIHIGGTNGKGSSSHMIASVLQEAGYKVGLYTSPHLKDFRERIKINGQEVSENFVCSFVEKNKAKFEDWNLSFFEWTVGLCFEYFKSEKVDIAIIEVGLGGRLDSTNIIDPLMCLITNIGLDHQQFLGNTKQAIAKEKAGIIKHRVPIVISETQPEVSTIFIEKAAEVNAPILFADQTINILYRSDLIGTYQPHNQKGILALLPLLKKQNFKITDQNIKNGLQKVSLNTGLKGRWQTLQINPTIICDTAHNAEGLSYVIKQLLDIRKNELHLILGFVNDKNVTEILNQFPKDAQYYLCQPKIPRALPIKDLNFIAKRIGINYKTYSTVSEALSAAKVNAKKDDLIFVGGSTFVVAEVV